MLPFASQRFGGVGAVGVGRTRCDGDGRVCCGADACTNSVFREKVSNVILECGFGGG